MIKINLEKKNRETQWVNTTLQLGLVGTKSRCVRFVGG